MKFVAISNLFSTITRDKIPIFVERLFCQSLIIGQISGTCKPSLCSQKKIDTYLENMVGAFNRISPFTNFTSTPGTACPMQHWEGLANALEGVKLRGHHILVSWVIPVHTTDECNFCRAVQIKKWFSPSQVGPPLLRVCRQKRARNTSNFYVYDPSNIFLSLIFCKYCNMFVEVFYQSIVANWRNYVLQP